MSSAQSQSVTTKADSPAPVLPQEMGLDEVMRVMDVASTLRREQELVDREFDLEKTKNMLREKLRRTAELTGETLTNEQIEAAVDWYYDNLHEYEEPEKSLHWYLAHLYVARTTILSFAVPILLAVTAIWALWFSPFAPFSEDNRKFHALATANQKIESQLKSIRALPDTEHLEPQLEKLTKESDAGFETGDVAALAAIQSSLSDLQASIRSANDVKLEIKSLAQSILAVANEAGVKVEVVNLQNESQTFSDNLDVDALQRVRERLATMEQRINEEFMLMVVAGENQRSATRRDFEDESGKRVSGYYLIVQARDKNGNLLKRRIQNIETDKFETVDTWGEKVPKAVYDRLGQDKKADGILNETKFAEKNRGELNVHMIMTGPGNRPIERSGQITDW